MGSVAAHESDVKGERVRRKMLQNAQAGLPHGPSRPFGYEADRVTVNPVEAAVVFEAAERLLAGESLTSLVRWLTEAEVPTATGKGTWRTSTVRAVLTSARISGQRETKGEIVGPAVWPGIITPAQTTRIRALLSDPARRTNRTARRYLLAGMLRCGRCAHTLTAMPRSGQRRYACRSSQGVGGCGGTYIAADPVEDLVVQAVLFRLDTLVMADALAGRRHDDREGAVLAEQMDADRAQMTELADLYGRRVITAAEWTTARAPIEACLAEATRRAARLTGTTAVSAWVGRGDALREQWSGLNLDRQRAIVRAVLDHAVVNPGTLGGGGFRPERVVPAWTR